MTKISTSTSAVSVLLLFSAALMIGCGSKSAVEVSYISSADNSMQPAMFYAPDHGSAAPLIVALHSWSGDYRQAMYEELERWSVQQGWAFIHPDFRGSNTGPEATGSELAVKDVIDAVEFAKRETNIDSSAVYLVGKSGGGHAALLAAGRYPELWAGVSVWVPIYDLKSWHAQQDQYQNDIERSCGGNPNTSEQAAIECSKRSPSRYLHSNLGIPIHINAGIRDGHEGSVPVSHSMLAFNALVSKEHRFSASDVNEITENAAVPARLIKEVVDPSYRQHSPLLRRSSNKVTLTIFDGGHEFLPSAAIQWINLIHTEPPVD